MSGRGGRGGGRGGRGGAQKGQPADFKFDFGSNAVAAPTPAPAAAPQEAAVPKNINDRINYLRHLQILKDNVEDEYQKEMDALEAKYNAMFQPFYAKRTEIVSGAREPTADELTAAQAAIAQREKEEEEETGEKIPATPVGPATDAKGIPHFWLRVLQNAMEFGQMITEKDEEVLKYLVDIQAKDNETGLELTFTFETNPFFGNTTLTKKYIIQQMGGQIMIDGVEECKINWREGKNITTKKVTKTVGGGGGGRGGKRGGRGGAAKGGSRTVTTEEPVPSFFHFFNPNMEGYEDEEEAEAAQEDDYELGMTLKEEIIPNAVYYYTGEAGGDDDELQFEEGDDEEEDDDEEDESDEDDSAAPAAPAGNQQECKQQ